MTYTDNIFSKIIRKEVPCHLVYEDERILSFLDIAPLSRGHTLVIPKQQCAFLHELTDEYAAALGAALPRIARAVMKATGTTAYNVLQNNGAEAHQAVFHVHFHIIPRTKEDGLGVNWKPGTLTSADAASLLQAIKSNL